MKRFSQKVVVITGAGSGVGQAAAYKFAEEGASIWRPKVFELT